MAAVGSLLVRIGADTGGLRRGGRQAQRTMQDMAGQARRTANRLAKFGAAAAAAAAAVGGKLVAEQLKAIDATAKLSDQIGTSTEAITGLQHAAEITGPGAEKMAAGLEVLTKRVGEAAQGSGEAVDAIEALGLSVEELDRMSPDQQFTAIARAMEGMESQSQKNAIAADLFSRANQDLVLTLDQGVAGIAALRREAADLGVTFDRVDAAKIEAANDAMFRVRQAITGVVRNLTIELAPILKGMADSFVSAAKEAGGMGAVVQDSVSRAVRVVGVFADGVHGLRIAFAGLKVIATGFAAAFWTALGGLMRGIVKLGATINSVINKALRAFNSIPGLADIPLLSEDVNPPFLQRIESIGQIARDNLGEARSALHELAMQELPSQAIERWVSDVRAGADEAAKAAAAAKKRVAATGGGEDEGDDGEDDAIAKRRERMQAELELMRAKLEGERAMENHHYEQQLKRLRTFRENELLTEQEFNELKAQAKANHERALTEIQKREQERRDRLTDKSYSTQVGIITDSLKQMSATVGSENKKMFMLTKVAAIADATVNAYKGISRTLAEYPYPQSVAMAALQASAAFAQVAAIKRQTMGGGGGGGSAAGTAGAGATSARQEPRREATIRVQGDSFSGDMISRLAEEMGEFLTDGGRLGRVNVQRS